MIHFQLDKKYIYIKFIYILILPSNSNNYMKTSDFASNDL